MEIKSRVNEHIWKKNRSIKRRILSIIKFILNNLINYLSTLNVSVFTSSGQLICDLSFELYSILFLGWKEKKIIEMWTFYLRNQVSNIFIAYFTAIFKPKV